MSFFAEGVVTLSGRNYVGLLIYNCFNASLRGAQICDTFSSPEPGNVSALIPAWELGASEPETRDRFQSLKPFAASQ